VEKIKQQQLAGFIKTELIPTIEKAKLLGIFHSEIAEIINKIYGGVHE
jgi:DNA-binding transcriptional regulator YhcF (GntR family)